ncbi:maleylpyruvate isomerase family mycothiol-dependent enzyme [Nocardia asteroides]
MDRDRIQAWLRAERLDLADFLDTLGPDDWARPSACAGWTVHDVLAHVTSTDTVRDTVVGLIRARGDWNRMTARLATDYAARHTPADLITQLRAAADSTRRAPGAAPIDPLVDLIVHGQDIARPLGRVRTAPTDTVLACLDHVLASRFYGARTRLRHIRLTATDTTWTQGPGPTEIEAPALDLLLVATGRPAP